MDLSSLTQGCSAEANFLLACVRLYCRPSGAAEMRLNLDAVNWSKLIEIAHFNSVIPILHNSLNAIASPHVPPDILTDLSGATRANSHFNLLRAKELLCLVACLKKQGIDVIPFKGLVLAEVAHGNLAMRQFGDLDLLVRDQDFWQAKAALMAQGYCTETTAIEEAIGFRRYCQISLSNSARSSSLDLHWGIPPRRFWHRDRTPTLWQNLQTRSLAGQAIQTFSIEVMLVIQAINAVKEPQRRPALKQVCDLAKLIHAYPTLDWERVWEIAGELRVQTLLLISLSLVHQLLQVSLPKEIQAEIAKNKRIEAIARRVNQQVVAKIDTPSESCDRWWSEYWYQLKTLDRGWHGGVMILQELGIRLIEIGRRMTPNEHDLQMVSLPDSLHFVYYFLRVLRVASKYLS